MKSEHHGAAPSSAQYVAQENQNGWKKSENMPFWHNEMVLVQHFSQA
jgi:hypothetical protein